MKRTAADRRTPSHPPHSAEREDTDDDLCISPPRKNPDCNVVVDINTNNKKQNSLSSEERLLYVNCVSVASALTGSSRHLFNWRRSRGVKRLKMGLGCSKALMNEVETEETSISEKAEDVLAPEKKANEVSVPSTSKTTTSASTFGTVIHTDLYQRLEGDDITDSHIPLDTITKFTLKEKKSSGRVAAQNMVRFTNALKELYFTGKTCELFFLCPLPRLLEMVDQISHLYVLRGKIDAVYSCRQWRVVHPETGESLPNWTRGLVGQLQSHRQSRDHGKAEEYRIIIEDLKTHAEESNDFTPSSSCTTQESEMQVRIYKYALNRLALAGHAGILDDPRLRRVWFQNNEPDTPVDRSCLNKLLKLSTREGMVKIPPHLKQLKDKQTQILKLRAKDQLRLDDLFELIMRPCLQYFLPHPDSFDEGGCRLQLRHISQGEFRFRGLMYEKRPDIHQWGRVVAVSNSELRYISEQLHSCDGFNLNYLDV